MSTDIREYRLRVCEAGADIVDDTTVEFMIELDRLHQIPIATSQHVYPLQARTDMRPFSVECVDIDGTITDDLSTGGRWRAIGRLCDVQYRPVDEDFTTTENVWVSYGTGRIAQLDQADGPGKFRIEIADESWKARRGRIFEAADTTQIWPAGVKASWRGFDRAAFASGTTSDHTANVFFFEILAYTFDATEGTTWYQGAEITSTMREWIRSDLHPEDNWSTVAEGGERPDGTSGGNFKHLRLNYGGFDYEIITFAAFSNGPILQALDEPREVRGDRGSLGIYLWGWAYIGSNPTPANTLEAYLHAPTAEPSNDLPLHVGTADTDHYWGTSAGFIHVADMTRRYCELLGLSYDGASFNEIEQDLSFPALSPRVTESPEDPEKWMQENIWSFCQVALLRTPEGKRKLVDLRPPREIDEYLPVLNETNSRQVRWRLVGRDMVNSIRYRFLKLVRPSFTIDNPLRDAVLGSDREVLDTSLDGFVVSDEYTDPEDGDTLADSGRRLHTFDARCAARVNYVNAGDFSGFASRLVINLQMLASGAGSPIDPVMDFLTPATLNTYQDGLIRLTGEVGGDVADTLEEGQLIYVSLDALGIPNPGFFGPELPGSVGPLVPGDSHGDLVAGPTLGTITLNADLTITVAVASVPVGQTAVVEYAVNLDNSEPPPSSSQLWQEAGALTTTGNVTTPVQERGTYVWIRVSGEIDDIRVSAFSTPEVVAITDHARIESAALVPTGDGEYLVTWQPSDLTLGVRVCWVIHTPGDGSLSDTCDDILASTKFFEIPDRVGIGQAIDVTITAYPGFTSVVTGTAGQTVPLSAIRAGGIRLNDLLDVDVDSPADGESLIYDSTTDMWVPGGPSAGPHDLDSHTDVTVAAPAHGDILRYESTGAQWMNTPLLVDVGEINADGTPSSTTFLRGDGEWAATTGSGATTLDGLTDVVLGSLEDGDILQYVETDANWQNVKPDIYFGTDFPQQVWGGRLAYRLDRNILYYYESNDARWLSTEVFTLNLVNIINVTATTSSTLSANPFWGLYDVYVETAIFANILSGTGNWTPSITTLDGASSTTLATGSAVTSTTWASQSVSVGTVVASTVEGWFQTMTENSGTASAFSAPALRYRLIG